MSQHCITLTPAETEALEAERFDGEFYSDTIKRLALQAASDPGPAYKIHAAQPTWALDQMEADRDRYKRALESCEAAYAADQERWEARKTQLEQQIDTLVDRLEPLESDEGVTTVNPVPVDWTHTPWDPTTVAAQVKAIANRVEQRLGTQAGQRWARHAGLQPWDEDTPDNIPRITVPQGTRVTVRVDAPVILTPEDN